MTMFEDVNKTLAKNLTFKYIFPTHSQHAGKASVLSFRLSMHNWSPAQIWIAAQLHMPKHMVKGSGKRLAKELSQKKKK